jgi:hypothetical protein
MEDKMHFCTRSWRMQIAIGQGRRNGKENEKEEPELGIEI